LCWGFQTQAKCYISIEFVWHQVALSATCMEGLDTDFIITDINSPSVTSSVIYYPKFYVTVDTES